MEINSTENNMLIFLSDQKTEKFFEKLRFADEVIMKSAGALTMFSGTTRDKEKMRGEVLTQ